MRNGQTLSELKAGFLADPRVRAALNMRSPRPSALVAEGAPVYRRRGCRRPPGAAIRDRGPAGPLRTGFTHPGNVRRAPYRISLCFIRAKATNRGRRQGGVSRREGLLSGLLVVRSKPAPTVSRLPEAHFAGLGTLLAAILSEGVPSANVKGSDLCPGRFPADGIFLVPSGSEGPLPRPAGPGGR